MFELVDQFSTGSPPPNHNHLFGLGIYRLLPHPHFTNPSMHSRERYSPDAFVCLSASYSWWCSRILYFLVETQ